MDENLKDSTTPDTETPQEPEPTTEVQDNFESPKPFSPDPDPEPEPERPSYVPISPRKRNPKQLLILLVAVVVVLLVLFNGIKFVASKFQKASPTPTPLTSVETSTPSPASNAASPSESPTATPAASVNPVDSATGLDRSQLSVTVQNGSGEAGVGAKAASFLKNLGYNVVSTGNASNFNYTNVTIQVKSSQKSYLPLLNKDLSASYSVGTTSSDLAATSSADALVIIGK